MCKTYLYLPFISSPVMGHMYGEMSKSLPALLASVVNAGLAVSLSSLTSYNTISIDIGTFEQKVCTTQTL